MSVMVEHLALDAAPDDRLAGFDVELPRSGERSEGHALRVSGWVAGRERRARAVEVVYHGRAIQVAQVRGGRNEDGATGGAWDALVGLIGLRADAELELVVVLDDDSRVPAARLKLRRTPLRSGFDARLQPLILTSLGRSGSTWLMKMFTAHPEIVVMRRFPYESCAAKYWMHAFKVLSDPADLAQSAHPDDFHSNWWWVGSNPFYDIPAVEDPERGNWLTGPHVERLAAFFQETTEQWYEAVARSNHQEAPRYFAEKHMWPNFLPMLMRELYPGAREVFLVRDFRDVACSALLMDERRGFVGFGRDDEMSDEHFVRDVIRRQARDMKASWEARGEGAHLVRYEDLAQNPHAMLKPLLEYLEVDSSDEMVEHVLRLAEQDLPDLPGTWADPALVAYHRAPEESIGKWRERNSDLRATLDEVLGEALDTFGYEREPGDGAPAGARNAGEAAVSLEKRRPR
jgi:sulfotransferase family protein